MAVDLLAVFGVYFALTLPLWLSGAYLLGGRRA